MGTGSDFDLDDGVQEHVVEQLLGKSWGELEVLEHAGYLLFPDSVYRRKKSGECEEIRVALRVPRQHELREARVEARRFALEDGLDLDRDRDLVEDLETICTLARAIRNAKPPHEPWEPDPRLLERSYDRSSLIQVWSKVDALTHLIDPAPHTITEEEMFALIAAISKERNILPLLVYAPDSRSTFIVTMASLLQTLRESASSSEPSAPSTPAS